MNGSLVPVLSGCVSRAAFFQAFLLIPWHSPEQAVHMHQNPDLLPQKLILKELDLAEHAQGCHDAGPVCMWRACCTCAHVPLGKGGRCQHLISRSSAHASTFSALAASASAPAVAPEADSDRLLRCQAASRRSLAASAVCHSCKGGRGSPACQLSSAMPLRLPSSGFRLKEAIAAAQQVPAHISCVSYEEGQLLTVRTPWRFSEPCAACHACMHAHE